MPFNLDPQTLQKLLFGGPQAAMMPQAPAPQDPAAPQAAAPTPDAQPPTSAPPRGSVANTMSSPEAAAPPSAPPQNAPIPQAPQPYHHGTLAKIMLGIGEALGNPLATHIGERDRARQQEVDEYSRNLPAAQYQANIGQQKNAADLEHTRAQTNLEKVQADIASQNLPVAEQAQKHYEHLLQTWQERSTPDFDSYARSYLAGLPDAIRRRLEPHLAEIKSAPQTGKGYKVNLQDDMPVSIESYGQVFQPDKTGKFPEGVPPQAQQEFQSALQAHQAKRGEKRADEAYVAGAAADRAGTAFSRQQQTTGQKEATTHLGEMRDAQNQLDLVNQLASSKSPTDQTSLAFKALGLDLPEGVHRINETELNAIRDQGGLSDRAYRTLLNWKTGQQFAPDILEDIKGTAQKIATSKIKGANDKLEDINRVYGYKAPGSDETGRMDKGQHKQSSSTTPAATEGQKPKAPAGATHTALGDDKKLHYTNSKGEDLGVAE